MLDVELAFQLKHASCVCYFNITGLGKLEAYIALIVATQAVGCGGQIAESFGCSPCAVKGHFELVILVSSEVRECISVPCYLDSCRIPLFAFAYQSSVAGDIELTHRVCLDPDSIAVAVSFLGEAVKTTTYLIAQLQNEPAILADNSRLIASLFGILILHFALRMHTHEVTRLNHRLDSILVGYPVRIEHTRDSRHRQDIRIRLQQTVFQIF